jgi:hypothetical protein
MTHEITKLITEAQQLKKRIEEILPVDKEAEQLVDEYLGIIPPPERASEPL